MTDKIDCSGIGHDLEHCGDYQAYKSDSMVNLTENINKFTYVDIVGDKYKGWLNLFFGEYCVAMIDDPWLADKIRKETNKKHADKR